ncbi:hypothetical protein OQA88_5140 [Cercophora sp. LCS_1]
MDQQAEFLYRAINQKSMESFKQKQEAKMAMNADRSIGGQPSDIKKRPMITSYLVQHDSEPTPMGSSTSKPKNVHASEENAARIYTSKREYAKAEEIYRDILAERTKKLELNDPDVLDTMSSLANVLEKQNSTNKIEEAAKIRDAIRERALRKTSKPATKSKRLSSRR